jgi:hypothetical protein
MLSERLARRRAFSFGLLQKQVGFGRRQRREQPSSTLSQKNNNCKSSLNAEKAL